MFWIVFVFALALHIILFVVDYHFYFPMVLSSANCLLTDPIREVYIQYQMTIDRGGPDLNAVRILAAAAVAGTMQLLYYIK